MNTTEKDFYDQENFPSWQESCLEELWGQLNSHIKGFIGREEWLKDLDNWVNINPGGYFLLTSPAGYGKSALLAKFTQLQKEKNICFIQMLRNHKSAFRLLQFLIWQIELCFENRISSYLYYSNLDELRSYLLLILGNLLLEKSKIIVVIDDLDIFDTQTLISLLPINLPQGVYFFLACRENTSLTKVLQQRLQQLTIKPLAPISNKETRLLFNNYLVTNKLESLSKNIEFQFLLKMSLKLLLIEAQNNITLLKLIIENTIKEIKQNVAEELDLEIYFSKNNTKLTFVILYNKLLLINKQTTKLDQKNVKLIVGLLAISYEPLSVNQLFEILCINDVNINKEQIENYLKEIEEHLIKLPNNKTVLYHHHFISFIKAKLIETKEIILIYDLLINWFDTIDEDIFYLSCIDGYLLDFALICLELNNNLKAQEVFVELINLLTSVKFVNKKIKLVSFSDMLSSYKKTISAITPELQIPNKNNLLLWFKFLDSESYAITQNIELDIFLQQAINQTIENNISEAALNYLEELNSPYIYINWLNKPVEHIYKALKQTLVNNVVGVQALKLTSDNKYLIAASEDGKIKIWDLLTTQEISTLTGHNGIIFSLTIDIDNQYIVSGDSNSTINIWDLTTKQLILSLKEHNGSVLSLLITSDNRYLISTSVDRSVKIWDFNFEILSNNPIPLVVLTEFNSIINTLTITSDNKHIILGSNDGKIIIWDLVNKQEVISLFGHDYGVTSLAVTLNNQYIVSAGEDRTIKIWELDSKILVATLAGATSSISKIKITSDNQYIIAGSNDKTIHIWNLTTGLPITALTGHNDLITDIEITSDGKYIISSGKDGDIKLWDLEYAKASVIQTKQRFNISAVAIASDGSLGVAGEQNGLIKVWQIDNKQEIAVLNGHQKTINALAITSDKKYLASASDDFQIKLWDLTTLECVATLNDHLDRVLALLITEDDKYLISSSDDKTIKIWDLDKKVLDTTLVDKAGVYALVLGQNNNQFLSANFRGKLRVWDLASKRILKEQKGWFDTKIALTKDNKYEVQRFEDNTLRVIKMDVETIAIFPTISLVIKSAISDNGVIISCDQLGNLYFLKLENLEY